MQQAVTGIILCGGKSSRMGGQPKGLMKYKNKIFIEHISETLKQYCDTILLSANSDDYSKLGYTTYKDILQDKGPLSGIHAGLYYSKTETTIFVPCDMPLIDKTILSDMIHASTNTSCVAPSIDGKSCIMPLVIKKTSMTLVEEQIVKGELKLGKFLESINCRYIPWKEAEHNSMVSMNINDPDEFLKLTS